MLQTQTTSCLSITPSSLVGVSSVNTVHSRTRMFSRTSKKMVSIRATRRILAPYVKARKKPKVEPVENKYFSFYVQKKPSILMKVMTKWCVATDLRAIIDETASVLKMATHSAAVTVYMVDETLDEIYQVTNSFESSELHVSYKIETGTTVAAHVAYTKKFIKIDDLLEDIRFPDGLGNQDLTVKAVMCVPVMTPDDECIAVFELYREMDDMPYDDRDLRTVIVLCCWVGAANYQNQQKLIIQKQQELNEYLLHLTECYFSDAMLLDKLITEVVNFVKIALNAEHGIFYVLKPKLNDYDEIYADLYEEGVRNSQKLYKKNRKIKLNDPYDLISIVAKNGTTINVKNAYNDNRVQQNKRGYKIRSIICIPIKCVDQILGVMAIMNKISAPYFEKSDEILLHTFSDFCGFVLKYGRLFNKMNKLSSLNNIYSEMLVHHMEPCCHDKQFISNHPEMPSLPERFNQFDFYIPETYELYMPQLTMYMIYKLSEDMFENISMLGKFVLVVQKCYKNLAYHNFYHAFNVCHCIYNIIRRNAYMFTPTEIKGLLIGALCHDIDHYGTSNNFLQMSGHSLSQLYEGSILENHHVQVTSLVFKFFNLFPHMSVEEYKALFAEVRTCILATDLSTHLSKRAKLQLLISENMFDFTNNSHRYLLKSVIMTLGDLSGLCKPFNVAKIVVDNLYTEFYNEGDKGRKMGICPISLMDREKLEMIPTDQINFLNTIVLPCATIVAKLLPNCEPLHQEAQKLKNAWKDIYDNKGQKLWTIEDSLPHNKRIFV